MARKQIMEGIRVADFSWVGVGPMAARALAEHGATVIRVESHKNPDSLRLAFPFKDGIPGINRSGFGAFANTNKFSMSVDLSKPKGKEVALRLIKWADIVTESYTPGTMAKFGLDYDSVKKVKQNVIYFSTTQQGQSGPHRKVAGYGIQGAAGAGFCNIAGWPDREPISVHGAYTDFISPWYLLVPLIGALIRLHKTGKGMYLDQSQYESAIHFLEPAILDYTVNGRVASQKGNRHQAAAPHNAYPCMGKDRWVAIAVCSDEQWRALCRVMGKSELATDPRFDTIKARKGKEEELDAIIGEWTKGYTAEEVMLLMQGAGVPSGVVSTPQDLFEDPQLKHRKHFVRLNHREIGLMAFRAPAFKLSKTPSKLVRPAPCLGEHNEFVYKEILKYSDEEIANMLGEGVITTEYDAPAVVRPKEPSPAKAKKD
jgi:benzylsuccinate CoA-transferase BbsF subunit